MQFSYTSPHDDELKGKHLSKPTPAARSATHNPQVILASTPAKAKAFVYNNNNLLFTPPTDINFCLCTTCFLCLAPTHVLNQPANQFRARPRARGIRVITIYSPTVVAVILYTLAL